MKSCWTNKRRTLSARPTNDACPLRAPASRQACLPWSAPFLCCSAPNTIECERRGIRLGRGVVLVPELRLPVRMRRCRGCRTVKRVKSAWRGNAVAMMHYLRIVNAGGRQKWHGQDHKDKAHPTLLFGVTFGALINCARIAPRKSLPVRVQFNIKFERGETLRVLSARRFILAPWHPCNGLALALARLVAQSSNNWRFTCSTSSTASSDRRSECFNKEARPGVVLTRPGFCQLSGGLDGVRPGKLKQTPLA